MPARCTVASSRLTEEKQPAPCDANRCLQPSREVLKSGDDVFECPFARVRGCACDGPLSGVAALAGYPNLSVPMGYVDGMPVGLSFVGPPWSEDLLLAMGYAYEQASRKRVPPTAFKHAPPSNSPSN